MKSGSENNVRDAVLFLMKERQKWKFKRNPSIYREILFLLILEFGANIINPGELLSSEFRAFRLQYFAELSIIRPSSDCGTKSESEICGLFFPEWLDREYHRVYDELSCYRNQIFQYDRYPSLHARFARRYFGDLDLF